jgi:hypothetical protein
MSAHAKFRRFRAAQLPHLPKAEVIRTLSGDRAISVA